MKRCDKQWQFSRFKLLASVYSSQVTWLGFKPSFEGHTTRHKVREHEIKKTCITVTPVISAQSLLFLFLRVKYIYWNISSVECMLLRVGLLQLRSVLLNNMSVVNARTVCFCRVCRRLFFAVSKECQPTSSSVHNAGVHMAQKHSWWRYLGLR